MTILTKTSDQKKSEKVILVPQSPKTLENGDLSPLPHVNEFVVVQQRRRSSNAATMFLFLTALFITCLGIVCGVIIYKQYSQKIMRFHGGCKVPLFNVENIDAESMMQANRDVFGIMDDQNILMKMLRDVLNEANELQEQFNKNDNTGLNIMAADSDSFLQEDVELDFSEEENVSKITPLLTTGQNTSFLHDFNAKQSGIIDKSLKRCYVMPLDTETLIPPKDMVDLIMKMRKGYYNINTNVLKKTMRVKTPAIDDMALVAPRILNECKNFEIFELEKIVTGVSKRSVNANVKILPYTEFGGNGINEYHIIS